VVSLPPEPDSAQERAIFACAGHVFLKTCDAPRALRALKCVFDGKTLDYTKLLLAFIRTAHYWTQIHPELVLEDDISSWLRMRLLPHASLEPRRNHLRTCLVAESQKS